MKNTVFTGAGVAITTPFNSDGSIDYNGFAENIEFQINNGTDAIVVCGTTGESSTMTDEEHIECIRFCAERTKGRVPVIAGTGSNDTRYAVELSKTAQEKGADALLVVTPYYNKATQKGLTAHFGAIADAVDIPIILYNIPGRTGGVNIAIDTYKTLGQHKNIVAVKEASGNISYTTKLLAECGDLLDVYSGNDDMIVSMMSVGAKGVISVLSNILPRETHDMAKLCLENNFAEAAKMQLKYLELVNNLFIEVNPIPIKEAMNLMKMPSGPCRLPLCEMTEANLETLKNSMKKLSLI